MLSALCIATISLLELYEKCSQKDMWISCSKWEKIKVAGEFVYLHFFFQSASTTNNIQFTSTCVAGRNPGGIHAWETGKKIDFFLLTLCEHGSQFL